MRTHDAGIDIHKTILQVAVLDPARGEIASERLPAERGRLRDWAERWADRLAAVAIEATTGWRRVARELQALGLDVQLADPGRASALQGRPKRAKTDRLDARWLVVLPAEQMLPEAWMPPADIARLRDQTRPRTAPCDDHSRWTQRRHALLVHGGWPCARGRLLLPSGRRWLQGLALEPAARARVGSMLAVMTALEGEIAAIDSELGRLAKTDARLMALGEIPGVGPILACHLLAEIGQGSRFRRARQVVRAAGLDPVVRESGEHRRRGRLAKQGSPQLRWALVEAAQHGRRPASPDHELYRRSRAGAGANPATLTVARKIARRAFHRLRAVEAQAA
jgi:transposase